MMLYQMLMVAALIVISGLVPGPNFILVASRSMEFGCQTSFWTVLGLALGAVTHAALGLLGFGLILTEHEQIFRVVKILGAAYLIWLGISSLRKVASNGLNHDIDIPEFTSVHETTKLYLNRPYLIWEAWLLQISNPETILFFIALFSSVVTVEINSIVGLTLIATVFASACLLYGILAIGLSTGKLRWFYSQFGSWINILFGALMIILGIGLGVGTMLISGE